MEKKGLNIRHLHKQATTHSLFMLMFMISGHLTWKFDWVKWDSPYWPQSFSFQRSNDKNGIVFRELKAWFVYATSHSILNPRSILLASTLQKQFVSRQHRIISSLFTKTSFSPYCACYPYWVSTEPELRAHIRLLMPWSESREFQDAVSFHCRFPLWQTKHCHLPTLLKPELQIYFCSLLPPTMPKMHNRGCKARALRHRQRNHKLMPDKLNYYLYLFCSTVVATLRCQILVISVQVLILQLDCQARIFKIKDPSIHNRDSCVSLRTTTVSYKLYNGTVRSRFDRPG